MGILPGHFKTLIPLALLVLAGCATPSALEYAKSQANRGPTYRGITDVYFAAFRGPDHLRLCVLARAGSIEEPLPATLNINLQEVSENLTEAHDGTALPDCVGKRIKYWDNCQGTYVDSSGDTYVGEFKNGKYHGRGEFIFSDGGTLSGEFKNGKFFYAPQSTASNHIGHDNTSLADNSIGAGSKLKNDCEAALLGAEELVPIVRVPVEGTDSTNEIQKFAPEKLTVYVLEQDGKNHFVIGSTGEDFPGLSHEAFSAHAEKNKSYAGYVLVPFAVVTDVVLGALYAFICLSASGQCF